MYTGRENRYSASGMTASGAGRTNRYLGGDMGARSRYFDGNAVRRLAVPERRPFEIQEETERRIIYSRSRRDAIENAYDLRGGKKKHRRAHHISMTIPHMILAIICMAGMFMIISEYLDIHSRIQSEQYAIMQLKSELNDKKVSNEEEYGRIMGSIDIEEIKAVAMNELGMKYPDTSQIVEFTDNNDDFVRQYKDIPGDQR